MAVPGLTPKSPVMTVGPVFVAAEPPSTAKLCAVPSVGAVCANAVWSGAVIKSAVRNPMTTNFANKPLNDFFILKVITSFPCYPRESVRCLRVCAVHIALAGQSYPVQAWMKTISPFVLNTLFNVLALASVRL